MDSVNLKSHCCLKISHLLLLQVTPNISVNEGFREHFLFHPSLLCASASTWHRNFAISPVVLVSPLSFVGTCQTVMGERKAFCFKNGGEKRLYNHKSWLQDSRQSQHLGLYVMHCLEMDLIPGWQAPGKCPRDFRVCLANSSPAQEPLGLFLSSAPWRFGTHSSSPCSIWRPHWVLRIRNPAKGERNQTRSGWITEPWNICYQEHFMTSSQPLPALKMDEIQMDQNMFVEAIWGARYLGNVLHPL